MSSLVGADSNVKTGGECEGSDEDADHGGVGGTGADEAPIQGLLSYVTELMEKGFPLPRIMAAGSSVSIRLLLPVKAEDTVSLTGRVVGKNSSGGLGLVECAISLENQDQELVAEARAVIAFPV